MKPRFRPQLFQFEAREVPAALSAQLTDGSIISGLFTTPSGADPTSMSGQYSLSDLTVTKNVGGSGGMSFVVQPGSTPTVTYENGVLVSVDATLQNATNGGDVMVLAQNSVQEGTTTAVAFAYDGAITMQTFTLPNGTTGAISYGLPYNQIDATRPNQTLLPSSGFNVNIAGQNFTPGSGDFTTTPTLQFSYGVLQGTDFALNTPGTPYLSISVAVATGIATIQTAPDQFIAAPAPSQNASIQIDFSTLKIPPAGGPFELTLRVITGDPKNPTDVKVSVQRGANPNQVRDAFNVALFDMGITAYIAGGANGTGLLIQGIKAQGNTPAKQLTEIQALGFTAVGEAPKFVTSTKTPLGADPVYSP